jgi:hypothetical protein
MYTFVGQIGLPKNEKMFSSIGKEVPWGGRENFED